MSAEGLDDQQQQQQQQRSQIKHRPFMMNRPTNAWEDGIGMNAQGASNALPRSPLAHDRSNTYSSQKAKTVSDQQGRRSVATTYAGVSTSRSGSNRQPKDRSVSVTIGRPKSPYASTFRFFLTVIPPIDLPQDPPHPRSQASSISISHTRRGTLLPLYPTLGGQLYAISREYGLPSIGGISLYLCDDGEGNLGPRVGDAAWSALWNRYFDDASEDLYQDITSPLPARSIFREQSHDRRDSGSSAEVPSPFADRNPHLRREVESGIYDDATFLRYEMDRRASSSAARLPPFASGYPASPSAIYHTPSPRYAKGSRSASRSSPYTPSNTQARLPIVGRIEWAIDKRRAPWWSHWIGEAESANERSISNIQTPVDIQTSVVDANQTKGAKLARRSMHLTTDLFPPRATSPLRSIPIQGEFEEDTERGNESCTDDQHVSQSDIGGVNFHLLGYQAINGDEQAKYAQSQKEATSDTLAKQQAKMGSKSHDVQSYAGYSALLDADEEAQTRDGESTRYGDGEVDRHPTQNSSVGHEDVDSFDVNLLKKNDESERKHLQGGNKTRHYRDESFAPPVNEVVSARDTTGETSAVHEWIVKTHSPRRNDQIDGYLDPRDGEEEEALLPPQDDMEEVLGLWAEKVKSKESPLMADLNYKTREGTRAVKRGSKSSHHSQSASLTASNYSTERLSPRSGQHVLQDHNEYEKLVKMGEAPETTLAANGKNLSVNKASLLSPIALDGASGTFVGPSANLASLLPTRSNNLLPNQEARQNTIDTITSSSVKSIATRLKEDAPLRQNSLSSPSLEIPDPHSPGAHSHHSSVTDVSDTLLDMERALELLSPSLSNNNHGSPAVNTTDSSYEAGSLTGFSRSKLPFVSSRESMARAKTLSTSVTPSPRWFRNGNTTASTSVTQSATAALHSRIRSAYEGRDEQEAGSPISVRPVSASASIDSRIRSDLLEVQASPSDGYLVDKREPIYPVKILANATESCPAPMIAQTDSGAPHVELADVPSAVINDGQLKEIEGGEETARTETEKVFNANQSHLFMDGESARLYESPVEIEGSRPQWLHPGEHLGKQGWSDSTIDHSTRQMPSQLSSQMQQSSTSEVEYGSDGNRRDEHTRLPSIDAMFSPRSGEYATVGVQAEREDGSRTNSLFSLVSDGATPSMMSGSHADSHLGDATNDTTIAMTQESKSRVQSMSNAELTPVMPTTAKMPKQYVPGKEDEQPSIQRLLRGNSFAESSVASSNATSVAMSPDASEQQTLYWQGLNRPNGDPRVANEGVAHHASKLYEMMTQESEEDYANRVQSTTVNDDCQGDLSRWVKAESENDSGHGGEWTYEGSDYDENRFDTEEYEGEATGDSPATTRISRMSAFSQTLPMNNAGLSDAGGRTPTFFYDQHLADDDALGGINASRDRLSKDGRASRHHSQTHTRPSTLGIDKIRPASEHKMWHLQNQQSPIKVKKVTANSPMNSDALDGDSYDSSRQDIVSMQGEPLNSSDDQMLKGFEQVSPDPTETHQPINGPFANGVLNQIGSKSEDGASSLTETATSLSPFPAQQQSPQTPSLLFDQPEAILTRRSLGSTGDSSKGISERDASPLRRASGSATSTYTRSASFTTSPRRFKGAMLRLASNMSSASSSNGQVTLSSRGNSPNQRFGALPPSPSLPGLASAGVLMSPTHSYTGTRSTSGGTLHSPTLTSRFVNRNATSPPYDKIDGIPPSPAFKFPRTAGTLTLPSPIGMTLQAPLAKNSNIVNTTS